MSSPEKKTPSETLSMAAGMVIGAVTGFAIWMATDTFVFFPVFIGVGLVFGLVFKEANERRRDD